MLLIFMHSCVQNSKSFFDIFFNPFLNQCNLFDCFFAIDICFFCNDGNVSYQKYGIRLRYLRMNKISDLQKRFQIQGCFHAFSSNVIWAHVLLNKSESISGTEIYAQLTGVVFEHGDFCLPDRGNIFGTLDSSKIWIIFVSKRTICLLFLKLFIQRNLTGISKPWI